ncbi:MAG: hypothetical protein M2R45_04529 [Verrucomicrobia subdivision 3 bacterium]|nr:hypothetical protein [Limisphaerales bacterium]MCS1416832.1 hypothetical protein [Limisphaerales bacterium]
MKDTYPVQCVPRDDPKKPWINLILLCVGGSDDMRACPQATSSRNSVSSATELSYPINDWASQPGTIVGFQAASLLDQEHLLDKLQQPAETIIVFEIADVQAMDVLPDHTHGRTVAYVARCDR